MVQISDEMGSPEKGKTSIFSNMEIKKISDNIICGNVLFWNSGKYLIVTSDKSCEMFSVNTGELVKQLFSCSSKIVSCSYHPREPTLLIAVTDTGEVTIYDLYSESVRETKMLKFKMASVKNLPKYNVNKKYYSEYDYDDSYKWDESVVNDIAERRFYHVVPVSFWESGVVLFTSWSLNDEHQCHLTAFDLESGLSKRAVWIKLKLKRCHKNFSARRMFDNNILVIGMGVNFIQVMCFADTLRKYVSQTHLLGDEVEVTNLVLHPSEYQCATADSRGIIIVWRNIMDRKPIKATYRWHTTKIRDLAFSDEGVHLFSGGDENVFVKWSFVSNEKDFLPRLSSPICYISVAENLGLVAISLADNEIFIIDSDFQKISVIKRCSVYTPPDMDKPYNILTSDPRTGHVVLNGRPGYLQFLSHKQNCKLLYSLDVGMTNYMTGQKKLINLQITHARFSRTGSWLVTAEERKDSTLLEYRLKFWYFDEGKQTFVLNTSVELPHDENDIHALEISSDDVVATSGDDKQFKLWSQYETGDSKTIWSVTSARTYKQLPCGPIDFSKDATLIAVGFGPSLTLWSANDCVLKCTLKPLFNKDGLRFVKFGSEEHSHLVVTATDYNIVSWNIITLTVVWTVDLAVSHLIGDFFMSYMCVFSKSNSMFVFSPATTSPEFVLENVSRSNVVVAHTSFDVDNDGSPIRMYFLNSDFELFCMDGGGVDSVVDVEMMEDELVTKFSSQFAKKSGGDVVKSVTEYVPTKTKNRSQYVMALLDAPAQALPNPLRFCSTFLESLALVVCDKPDKKTSEVDDGVVDAGKMSVDKPDIESSMTNESLLAVVNGLFK